MIWWKVYSFNCKMKSRDFRALILYEWKNKHNALAVAQNINTALRIGSVNERTIQCWYAKFEIGDESLANEDWYRPETEVL